MTPAEVKDVATVVSLAFGAGSLLSAALSFQLAARTNRAKFWLDLRSAFAKHEDVHLALRPGGKWADGCGPSAVDEFASIEAYMGLFEHCEIMLEQRLLDEKTFREIYLYRLNNLVANRWIREQKLCRRAAGWKRFIELLNRMGVTYECAKVVH
jgi:hypothetical protein